MKKLLIILIISTIGRCYAIQGNWKLTDIQQTKLSDLQNMRVQIKDFVYRNSTIRWSLTFIGCKTYKYMMDIENRNIFIDMATKYTIGDDTQKCQQLAIQKRSQDLLNQIFTFQIISSFMIFSDPQGVVLFKLQRIIPNTEVPKIDGAWMADILNSNKISQIIQINDKNITFCQRMVSIQYKISGKNKIDIGAFKNNGCQNSQLINAIRNAIYFVKRTTKLQLYDQDDNLLISVNYIADLQTVANQRQQQQKQQQMLRQQQLQQQRQQQLQQQRQMQIQNIQPVFAAPPPPPTLTRPKLTNTISDYIGKWAVSKIFNIPNYSTNVDFVISNGTIIISSKCNTYILTFTAPSTTPIQIKRQNFRAIQSDTKCANDDDGLYKTGLAKIAAMRISVENQKYIVSIVDDRNQQVFQLQKPVPILNTQVNQPFVQPQSSYGPAPMPPLQQYPSYNQPNINNILRNSPPPPPFSSPFPGPSLYNPNQIQPGRYTVLLLRRRDIVRKIIMIDNNSFILKVCNQLKITYTTSSNNLIKFKITKNTSNSCDTTQQNLFIDFFSKISSFYKQGQDVFLKNSNDEELITLNNV